MYFTPNIALFLSHDPPPIPPATPRATNSSDPPCRSLLQPTTPSIRSKIQALFSLVLSQPPTRGARRSQATLRITNGIGWQSSSGINRSRREDGRRATSRALGRTATVRMVSSREPLPEHREPLPEHRDEGVSATGQQQQQQQQQHGEPARQRTKGPSRARNLGRAADGNRRGAFVGEPGTGSSWPTGKESYGGPCRRVLNTPHQAGSKHEGWSVCAHILPKPCEPAGRDVRGLSLSR